MANIKKKFTKEENKICKLMAWLACHADEDCPAEYRSRHFKNALDQAVEDSKTQVGTT